MLVLKLESFVYRCAFRVKSRYLFGIRWSEVVENPERSGAERLRNFFRSGPERSIFFPERFGAVVVFQNLISVRKMTVFAQTTRY